ncbi:MAG: hypothetical protein LBE91_12980 [Tannerella sp.]|nr:hypothetical protein [Tannerella sp.]
MIRQSFFAKSDNSGKRLLILFLLGMMAVMYGFAQGDGNNHREIADEDTILLASPYYGGGVWDITGAIYKAIDPRLIANKYGFLEESRWTIKKRFSLFIYDQTFPVRSADTSPILGGHKRWTYYINDIFMSNDGRALVSAIMPQAIESMDFYRSNSNKSDSPKGLDKGGIPFYIYTRDISKSTINDNTTVYLVDNNQVITRKIYDAINPVFIRSLRRITNPEELADCGYKEKTEVVKIDLFELGALTEDRILYTNDCPECEVILVDNIQINWKIYQALNQFHIKEIREIKEDEKKAFAPYRKLFPKGKLFGPKHVTVISL